MLPFPVSTSSIDMSRYTQTLSFDLGSGVDGTNPATGNALHVEGDWMFIGDQEAPLARDGSVHVYKRNDGVWTFHETLTKGNGLANPGWFGYDLDRSGDWLAVSTTHQTGWVSPSGAEGGVELFKYNSTTDSWEHQQSLIGYDAAATSEFGLAVRISGDYLAVGSPYHDTPAANCGKFYIYRLVNGVWALDFEWQEASPTAQNTLGLQVEIDGNYAFAFSGTPATYRGTCYCFKVTNGTWSLHQTITSPSPQDNEGSGRGASCDGEWLVLGGSMRGANYGGTKGYVHIYKVVGTTWTHQVTYNPPNLHNQAWFPANLMLSGGYIIAGSLWTDRSEFDPLVGDSNGNGKGRVIVFERLQDDKWRQYPMPATDLRFGDWNGAGVAVESDGTAYSLAFGTEADRTEMRVRIFERTAGANYSSVSAATINA
jgi:hypothetical protein